MVIDGAAKPVNAVVFSPELLKVYYERLFPFEFFWDWFSYGEGAAESPSTTTDWGKREWSFTLCPTPTDEIYIRYQSFKTLSEFKTALLKRQPNKIDIGAVFSHPPKDHKTLKAGTFHTVSRELVFDIDLTDYDCVRTCCSGANICPKCWRYMTMAVKVMDSGLRRDFGFEHLAWFYSGRRGVHCWVCDESARDLSNDARSAVAQYFELPLETDKSGPLNLPENMHPMLEKCVEILEPMFIEDIITKEGMGLLANPKQWVALLQDLPKRAIDKNIGFNLNKEWTKASCTLTPAEKWRDLKSALRELTAKGGAKKAPANMEKAERTRIEMWAIEIVFKHTYPRLDINVSKMQNHLLKSPFCVHPKTGRVCIPMDPKTVDTFDPFAVPTLPQIVAELDAAGKSDGSGGPPDWTKTSLKGSFERFVKDFLTPLKNANMKRNRKEAEKEAAITGDF